MKGSSKEAELLEACRKDDMAQVEAILDDGHLNLVGLSHLTLSLESSGGAFSLCMTQCWVQSTSRVCYIHEHCQGSNTKNTRLIDLLIKHGADVDLLDEVGPSRSSRS